MYNNQGLNEHIYSNRTEYSLNGKYLCNTTVINNLINNIHNKLIDVKIYPTIYKLISEIDTQKKNKIEFIKKDELYYDSSIFDVM